MGLADWLRPRAGAGAETYARPGWKPGASPPRYNFEIMKFLLATLAFAVSAPTFAADYQLKATPSTVVWGYYWSGAKPVLRIQSGDTVTVQTLTTGSPTSLARAGVKDSDIQQELKDITAQVKREPGLGGHILTGPIYIEGAEPGDTLEVRIQKIKLSVPYATNSFSPQRGVLPATDFQQGRTKLIPLDADRMVAKFSPGIELPLHPFFGSMGVAPAGDQKANSGPPGAFAGNLDNKDLIAGTKLFIPVFAPGALFLVGDGHAGQGNGEADITAMETSLEGTFQFVVRKDMHLKGPRGETPTHWIAMGLDPSLDQAMIFAVRDAIDFLVTEKHLSREEAYALCSVAVDFNVTQAVDGTKGVHGMIPKSIFK
jgi:acetamidase/formamidase